MKRLRLDEQQLQPRLEITMPETLGGGGDSGLTRGQKVFRSRSQAISVILNLFQDLVIRCKEAKKHRCEVFNVKKINNLSILYGTATFPPAPSLIIEGATHVGSVPLHPSHLRYCDCADATHVDILDNSCQHLSCNLMSATQPHNDNFNSKLTYLLTSYRLKNKLSSLFTFHPSLKPKAAFTLAEVLITLGIIGVVAAMTMPVLINNTRNKQLETAFKAAYSILSQAVITVAEEQGGALRSSFAISEERPDGSVYYPDAKIIRDSLFSKLKVAGTCTYTGNVRNYSKTTDNTFIDRGTVKPSKALANGMCFDIYVNAAEINLTIDVNGTKGPNILGYDIFFFDIDKKDRLNPKRATGYYSEEELEQLFPGDEYESSAQSPTAMQLGNPCSINATQRGNGLGCAYYALIDKNPDDEAKGYWESLR